MKNVLLQAAQKMYTAYRRQRWWRWTVRSLAMLVVFCTTYMLILPAITMHSESTICGMEEHIHSADCSQPCLIPEHIHTASCYPIEEENKSIQLCGSGAHTHVESCYDDSGKLICNIPEHTHEAVCYVEDLDLTADVETLQQWQEMRNQLTLTGNWPEDVLLMANTQLGYAESVQNVVLEDGKLKGYTRYGARYDDPYGDWNTMFASFVLQYANIDLFGEDIDLENWIDTLTAEERYYKAGTHNPALGNLVFFGKASNKGTVANRVAFVAEIIPATKDKGLSIKVIEGDVNGKVAYVTYELDDPTILGYGVLPGDGIVTLIHRGADYSVTVNFGRKANIPASAVLTVRELLPGTAEYEEHYKQSVAALVENDPDLTEESLSVSFARFFDICFMVDGKEVEPATPVAVKIHYDEAITPSEDESGFAIHFGGDGVEIKDAETSKDGQEKADEVDTFTFEQDGFSVIGTMVTNSTRAIGSSATPVEFSSLNASAGVQYLLYTEYNGRYYAITSKPGDVVGYAVPITINEDGTVSLDGLDSSAFWNFRRSGNGNSYYVQNHYTGRYIHAFDNSSGNRVDYGTTTAGENASTLTASANGSFIMQGYRYYTGISVSNGTVTFNRVSNQRQAAQFNLAIVGKLYNVWFDGTNGGMMSYYGSDDTNLPVSVGNTGTTQITLPETWKSSTKYPYKLQGWFDIKNNIYYPVDPDDDKDVVATIRSDTVFYADWVAATYDVGQDNEHAVESVDTNNFITTYVFDYNVLFNLLSQTHTGTVSSTGHKESWTVQPMGTRIPYSDSSSLNFTFVDYDADGEFSYAYGRDDTNTNQGDAITPGILEAILDKADTDLLDLLFNPVTPVIGKNYVGTGNYLFQYMDSTTENYDGIHDGYYYLDARLNAASYNQTLQRFFVYDYLERTSDSNKDGGVGQYSDFLPFNSPYLFDSSQLDEYTDMIRRPGYEYDSKDGESSFQEYNNVNDATTNYFFGIRTDIEFFLPNDTNTRDEYGNYGNVSTRGEHMVFDFHGDDDVWVFVDGELLLDIGGLHGVMFGQIDFSTGQIIVGKDGGQTETIPFHMSEGTHMMTVYYMERGSSQSNCAIYFNIAPRYDLEITKEDIVTVEKLNGAVFTIYNDEEMTNPAQLWDSEEAYRQDMLDGKIDDAKSTFTVVDGIAKCWGISAGKTYYIYETTPPPGYPESDDMIRITLNNRGTATIETTTIHGQNGIATEGFAVIKQEINETLKIVALTVTNQKEGDTTEVRVEKTWAEGSVVLPHSIVVYLTADGKTVGRQAILHEGNGWSYTWTGLPKYAETGIDREIVYVVEEVLVPNYITTQGESKKVENYVDWIRVDQMSDSKTYLLVHNGQALTYNGSFGWLDPAAAELDSSLAAQWTVTTDHDGFHLKNGLGYTLTFDPDTESFYGVNDDRTELNQVFYYLNSRLVIHDHDVYYQFGEDGESVAEDGLSFILYQKEVLTGLLTGIVNVPVDEEEQTHVEVTKTWDDGYELHEDESVVISLYADGKDTGRDLILSAENNWTGGFYDLPYYREDGMTPVVYTVVEDDVPGYQPFYADPETVDGLPVTIWKNADTLENGKIYRFTFGSYALAVGSLGDVISLITNMDNESQQWEVVVSGNRTLLRNVATGLYLMRSGTTITTTDSASDATSVTLTNDKITLGSSYYLELGTGYVSITRSSANATLLTVTVEVETRGMPGTAIGVTNVTIIPPLPHTGGVVVPIATIGALLILAAAVVGIMQIRRKRQKGGN